jgi:hypothetical protein
MTQKGENTKALVMTYFSLRQYRNDITWGIYDNLLDLDSVMDRVHHRLHDCKHF